MLAETARGSFDDPAWLFEPKWDGYRALAFLDRDGDRTLLQSRRLRDLTRGYPELGVLHRHLDGRQAVVDGEIVALRDGRPDFQTLQGGGGPVVFVAFDLLGLDGACLLSRPLRERKELLARRLGGESGETAELIHSMGVEGRGRDFHRAAVAQGLEGTVAKRLQSLYYPGRRTRDWLKVRNVRQVFALVCGYTRASDARPFGALVLGVLDPTARLTFAGQAGTGFDRAEMARLAALLGPPAACPFPEGEPRELRARTTWVRPEHVVEIESLQWTREGRLRHPVYRGRRPDKGPADCTAPGAAKAPASPPVDP